MIRCPHCDAELAHPASCGSCGRLLEIPDEATPYAVLGLGDAKWAVERDSLRKRLLQLSRDVHPDFFGTAGADVRGLAERNSARLNDAYAILSDDVARADWLVEYLGGPDEQTERAMPPEFLAEVLEWNELLEEARDGDAADPRLEPLERDLRERRAAALDTVAKLLTPLPQPRSPELKRVRAQLNAVRYVDRALSEIATQRLARASQN
jgi:DnaJ-domain-containing protein 1